MADTPTITDGWLVVPCDARDRAAVYIATGQGEPGPLVPAYRDVVEGRRVAKIRPPERGVGQVDVWIQIDGSLRRLNRRVTL